MQAHHLTIVHYPPEQSWSRMEVESPKCEDVALANGATNEISVPVGFIKQSDPVALFTAEMHFDDSAAWKIADITPGASGRGLTLDQAIPQSDKGGFLADPNYAGARYIWRNNQFLHDRARGIL
jgi:hypothetical protein